MSSIRPITFQENFTNQTVFVITHNQNFCPDLFSITYINNLGTTASYVNLDANSIEVTLSNENSGTVTLTFNEIISYGEGTTQLYKCYPNINGVWTTIPIT